MVETTTRGKGPVKVLYKGSNGKADSHIPDDVSSVVFVSNYDNTATEVPMEFPDNVLRAFVARSLGGLILTHIRNGADTTGSNIKELIKDKVAQFAEGQAYIRTKGGEPKERVTKGLDMSYWEPVFSMFAASKAKGDKSKQSEYLTGLKNYFAPIKPKAAISILRQWEKTIPDFNEAKIKHDGHLASIAKSHAPKMSVEDEMAAMFAVVPKTKKAA